MKGTLESQNVEAQMVIHYKNGSQVAILGTACIFPLGCPELQFPFTFSIHAIETLPADPL